MRTKIDDALTTRRLTLFSFLPQIDRTETNFFEGDPLRALSTLAFSDNVDLQRSAALAFAEITEKGILFFVLPRNFMHGHCFHFTRIGHGYVIRALSSVLMFLSCCLCNDPSGTIDVRNVDRDTLEPVLFLLQSHDVEVQRAASAALGNLAVNSKAIMCKQKKLRPRGILQSR